MEFQVYDTTLRDGAQREGISYSVPDKLAVARLLDDLGVGFIEGGWRGAFPTDTEFIPRARRELQLRHATLVAFGATRRAGGSARTDPQVRALLAAESPAVCLVAKSDLRHVERGLRTAAARGGGRARSGLQVRAWLDAETPAVWPVAEADLRPVERALRSPAAANGAMVGDSVGCLGAEGRRVVLDRERFFDGFRHDP